MKAVTFHGVNKIQVDRVDDPSIQKKDDIIVRITSTSICGSDLHIYKGVVPTPSGFIIGHEPMGIVEEVGSEVTKVKKGDRVIIPFTVACGKCYFCQNEMESQCDHSNPNPLPKVHTGGYLGYTKRYGNYPGAQAEFLRVPFGNFMPFVVPESCDLPDESLLFLSDVLPTAYWSVENAGVKPGDTVIVLGCGPVGIMTQSFALLKGAHRVIAVDHVNYRLEHAKRMNQVEVFNLNNYSDMGSYLHELTSGGAEVVIDCVGMDGKKSAIEAIEQKLKLQGGTLSAIQIAIKAIKKFGTIQLTGVYGSVYHMFPLGSIFERNINLKMGLAPANHYVHGLFNKIVKGIFDPTQIITHTFPLDQASKAYKIFNNHEDECMKVILKP